MKPSTVLIWDPAATPEALHPALDAVSEFYPVFRTASTGSANLFWTIGGARDMAYRTERTASGHWHIVCNGETATALRALGAALGGIAETVAPTGFKRRSVMFDCSRNQVFTVDSLQRRLVQLALLGYNEAWLYCEDTYQLAGEPFFGHMRGGYSAAELHAIDAQAARLGIELSGCIQTLGHMEQALKWREVYGDITDCPGVLLPDEPRTYELIGKMLHFWSENLRSRRLHIGFDEAHNLGRGQFFDRFGHEDGFAIFTRHLQKVAAMCRDCNLKPMIWSDMYFRLANPKREYYNLDYPVPDAVKREIPPEVGIVYWDYYHRDRRFYREYFAAHRQFGNPIAAAAGIWTFNKLWYDRELTLGTITPMIAEARAAGIDDFTFTLWGDDGSYCHIDSAMLGLAEGAELLWGGDAAGAPLKHRFRSLNIMDYDLAVNTARLVERHYDNGSGLFWENNLNSYSSAIFWDDILLNLGFRNMIVNSPENAVLLTADYAWVAEFLNTNKPSGEAGKYAAALADLLTRKLALQRRLRTLGAGSRADGIKTLADKELPRLIAAYETFAELFRRQWLAAAKPFGLEVIQQRLGGIIFRLGEARRRLHEYADGDVLAIPELAEPLPPRACALDWYKELAGASVIK